MSDFLSIFDVTLLNSIFRFVTPILLAALGGLLCDRVGLFNVALEGLMLMGAFAAIVGSYYSSSAFVGVLSACLAGGVLAALFALLTVTLKGNVIVLGIATNLLTSGLTVFLLRGLFGVKGAFQDPRIQGLPKIDLPLIGDLPVIGPLVSDHTILVYISWLLVFLVYLLVFRFSVGLRMRGIGEQPEAAATLGVNVNAIQYLAIILSGVLCGMAGAQLSLGNVTLFVENMSAGRGWIAVVAVMLGQAHPVGVFISSFLFGLADSAGFRLQGLGLPSQFTSMIPYLVTLLTFFIIRARQKRQRSALAG